MIVLVDPHIPGYRVERLIGSGGMASVYLAIQESLERPVALKVLDDPESVEYQERFLNEGRIIASLTHTNIVTVHDIGVANRHLYISMEYVEGGDLRKHIRQGIDTAEAFDIVEKIGNALKLAHDRGVIHRDVKPANILFRTDGTPLLADFGIAKDYQRNSDLTLDGSLVGSPYYLSPEQARAHPIDGRADIYSLGVILYEMLAGLKPFKGESAVDTVFKHLNDPVPTLPEELVRLQWMIEKMLAKHPQERFADAGEMLEAVRQIKARGFDDLGDRVVHGADTVRMPAATPGAGRARRAAGLGAIAAVVTTLAIGAWLYFAGGKSAGEPDVLALAVGEPDAARAPGKASGSDLGRLAVDGDGADANAGRAATGERQGDLARDTSLPIDRVEPAVKKVKLDASETASAAPARESPPAAKPDPAPEVKPSAKTTPSSKPAAKPAPTTATRSAPPSKPAQKSTKATAPAKRSVAPKPAPRPTVVAKASPPPPRKTSRELEVERLLQLGRVRLDEDKLSRPARDSAIFYRDEVLALDPDNPHARRLGDDIVDRYVVLAEESLSRGEYFNAKKYIDQGLDVDPTHDRLRWLKANALEQSARGFMHSFQRSLTTPAEPTARQGGVPPDK